MAGTPPSTSPPPAAGPGPAAPKPRRRSRLGRRGWTIAWAVLAFIVARIVAQSGGRLGVEGTSGSITGTMRFRRIAWHGPDTTVVADDVVIDWNPGALWSSTISIG